MQCDTRTCSFLSHHRPILSQALGARYVSQCLMATRSGCKASYVATPAPPQYVENCCSLGAPRGELGRMVSTSKSFRWLIKIIKLLDSVRQVPAQVLQHPEVTDVLFAMSESSRRVETSSPGSPADLSSQSSRQPLTGEFSCGRISFLRGRAQSDNRP